MDEITERSKSLSLTAEEEDIIRDIDGKSILSHENIQLYLVGKILSSKFVNFEAFCSTMKNVWGVSGDTRFEVAGSNLFVIQFKSFFEKKRVLMGGPGSLRNLF